MTQPRGMPNLVSLARASGLCVPQSRKTIRHLLQVFIAAKPACVREYAPLNCSLISKSFSVSLSKAGLCLSRSGPKKHSIFPGVTRYFWNALKTVFSDGDNEFLLNKVSYELCEPKGILSAVATLLNGRQRHASVLFAGCVTLW